MKQILKNRIHTFAREQNGSTLVEFAIVIPLLLLFVMGVFEFGRLGYSQAMAQKATELAARIATVRPAICPDVPTVFSPAPTNGTEPPRFGTLCRGGGVCAIPDDAEISCTLDTANATSDEVWTTIVSLLPAGTERRNVEIRYSHDDRLGFLGGPYTPIVTAELVGLTHQFVTPLGLLAELASGNESEIRNSINFPNMSASLPAEDLGQGTGL